MSKSKSNPTFFWDEKMAKKNHRSRFNLLLLEYGEYFLEDLSVFFFPLPTNDFSKVFEVSDSLKIQGRLKLNTRSLIFEPTDIRFPLVKFPYKSMNTPVERFNLKDSELRQLSVTVSGFFTFMCNNYFEMKANDKIGPYKLVDNSDGTTKGNRVVFALVHSDLMQFLVKVEQFRHIFSIFEKKGSAEANQLLRPFIDTALLTNFDTSHLVDYHEKLLLVQPVAVKKIKPLIINPGSLMLTNSRIYFQPSSMNNIADAVLHFEMNKIVRIYKRRYMLRQVGLEFLLSDNISYLFAFECIADRDNIYAIIVSQNTTLTRQPTLDQITMKWQNSEISNFEYLMYLNNEADRSGNDLTQYPVFPHLIADFSSKKLNLTSPSTFRDLSKPIGALNADRLRYFKERFQSMAEGDPQMGIPPPFLYGTHYSTPGYVLYYLVRVAPEYMLCLQNGKFDAADRMFHSIADTYESVLTNHADLKESIPEFYCGTGEFLVNYNNLDLGHRHTGERLYDVILPNWADSPRDYIRKNAKALECEYVSQNIHHWIDLIFGYKQKGQAAIDADNLYYYLTYEGSVDVESIKDSRERSALELQIQEFGQTPKQLFTYPHPKRFSTDSGADRIERGVNKQSSNSSVGGVGGSVNNIGSGSNSGDKLNNIDNNNNNTNSNNNINNNNDSSNSRSNNNSLDRNDARNLNNGGDINIIDDYITSSHSDNNSSKFSGGGELDSGRISPFNGGINRSTNNINSNNTYLGMTTTTNTNNSTKNNTIFDTFGNATHNNTNNNNINNNANHAHSRAHNKMLLESGNLSELDRIMLETEDDDDDLYSLQNNIKVLSLDEDFKNEVARELSLNKNNKQNNTSSNNGSDDSSGYDNKPNNYNSKTNIVTNTLYKNNMNSNSSSGRATATANINTTNSTNNTNSTSSYNNSTINSNYNYSNSRVNSFNNNSSNNTTNNNSNNNMNNTSSGNMRTISSDQQRSTAGLSWSSGQQNNRVASTPVDTPAPSTQQQPTGLFSLLPKQLFSFFPGEKK